MEFLYMSQVSDINLQIQAHPNGICSHHDVTGVIRVIKLLGLGIFSS